MSEIVKIKLLPYYKDTFKKRVLKHDNNQTLYATRKVGKVFNVSNHFKKAAMVRIKDYKGNQLFGQYDLDMFKIIQTKVENILHAQARAACEDHAWKNTHDQHVRYSVIDTSKFESLWYPDLPRVGEDFVNSSPIRCHSSKYCYAELGRWLKPLNEYSDMKDKDFYEVYDAVSGTHECFASVRAAETVFDAALKVGLLKDAQYRIRKDKRGTEWLDYIVKTKDRKDRGRLYFQLSLFRMAREYNGTINCAAYLINKYKVSVPLALTIAYKYGTCGQSSLHMAWSAGPSATTMARAMTAWMNGVYTRYDERAFRSSNTLSDICEDIGTGDYKDDKLIPTLRSVTQYNNYVMEGV